MPRLAAALLPVRRRITAAMGRVPPGTVGIAFTGLADHVCQIGGLYFV